MEKQDLDLIKKYMERDAKLRKLYNEHLELEKKLESFNEMSYLTPQDEIERARLKKIKLKGRDMMDSIISKYKEDDNG